VSDDMMTSAKSGSERPVTRCNFASRLETRSYFLTTSLAHTLLIYANTVCGHETAEALTATVTCPVHPVLIRNERRPLIRVVVTLKTA
jgi:hypothetical protein